MMHCSVQLWEVPTSDSSVCSAAGKLVALGCTPRGSRSNTLHRGVLTRRLVRFFVGTKFLRSVLGREGLVESA